MIIPIKQRMMVELYVEELWELGVDSVRVNIHRTGVTVSAIRGQFVLIQDFAKFEHLNIGDGDRGRISKDLAYRTMREFERFERG